MAPIDASFFDIGRLDRLARQDTPVHRLDPRVKLLTTLAFLVSVVSFGKYEVSALLPFFLYPIALGSAGRIPFGYVGKRLLAVAPFALLVGIFNPFLDRETLLHLGSFEVSGGWVSFLSIQLRFTLTVGTALILIATTSFQGLCGALQRLGTPQVLTVQLLFLYRYLFVLGEEALRLVRARALRSFGRRGTGMRVYGSLVGHLLLRTLDRAQRIHLAMRCRGFTGEIRGLGRLRLGLPEAAFAGGWCAAFVALRLVNVPHLLGSLVEGLWG
ncbi:MAG: cobalt ECF transporter T component CbiQ [Deferrisomatales bacterium]|nr:cobalt ECF transporter T component CbiQ [Deferrisomatales bacterium]